MICNHFCNAPLRCRTCIARFWKWAQNHTRGRAPKVGQRDEGASAHTRPSFYEAAAKWSDVDARSIPRNHAPPVPMKGA